MQVERDEPHVFGGVLYCRKGRFDLSAFPENATEQQKRAAISPERAAAWSPAGCPEAQYGTDGNKL
jgi:hypothetical protein